MKTKIKHSDVTKLLYSMFVENTGSSILDSGSAYGRNHERNAGKTIEYFINKESAYIDEYWIKDAKTSKDLIYSVSSFKYLDGQNFELDAICKKFNKLNEAGKDNDFEDFYGTCLKAGQYLKTQGFTIENAWNTYNDSYQVLDQVLQGAYLTNEAGERYVLLQVHGGCDVRGGYTDAKMFKLDKYNEYLTIPDVYGSITNGKKDYSIDNTYDGGTLTGENGAEIKVNKNSKISIELMLSN
jgi:hypothetical protein